MDPSSDAQKGPTPVGCALALAIGLCVVVVTTGGHALITGKSLDLDEEWGVLLFQALLAGAPFGLLAISGIRNRAPWLVGIAMTVAFWGYYFFDGVRYQLSGDSSGANIGLGILMMVSPIIITGACFVTSLLQHPRS